MPFCFHLRGIMFTAQAGATMEDDSTILLRLEGHRCRLVNNGIQASALEPGYCATKWV